MSNNLADIVNVHIELERPVINGASFSNLLIVGPEPESWQSLAKADRDSRDTVYSCTNLNEVTEEDGIYANADKDTGDAIGNAARVAFSQDPAPSKIFIAVNRKLDKSVTDCDVRIASSAADLPAALVGEEAPTGFPWLVLSYQEADTEAIRTTVIDISRNGVQCDPVSATIDGIKYAYVALGENAAGSYTIKVEDTVYANERKREEDVSNFTNCHISFDVVNDIIDRNSFVRDYEQMFEPITDTLNRALDMNGWYVICPAYTDTDILADISDWTGAQEKLMAFPVIDASSESLFIAKQLRSFGIFSPTKWGQALADIPKDNLYAHVAWTARCLNFKPGSETWALKTMVGIEPSVLSSTQMQKLQKLNISYYTTYADRDVTQGGMVTYGEYIDTIRFRDWIKNEMQIAIYDLLVRMPKVPYTDRGIGLVHNKMIEVLKRGQDNGGIAPTEYNSDGDEIPGFVTSVPLAANIPDSVKASRVLHDCTFRARLQGAIHVVNVFGTLAYSL